MKILYFYQYFSTPKGAWGTRVYEFTKEWVGQGHEVIIVSSIYSKSDLKASKIVEEQDFDGIKVKVINVLIDNKQPFLNRVFSFLKYSLISSYFALIINCDIVIASSGPITVGIPGLIAKYFRKRKLIFEVRDIWPEGAIELGIIKNRLIKKIAYWFERKCYQASDFIVTLSPGMTENIKARFNINNILDVTNSANIALFLNFRGLPNSLGLKSKKYAIYTGNIGSVNNSYWLYNAAKNLQKLNRADIEVVLVGDGQQKKELEELVKSENVSNFKIIDLMPKEDLVPLVQNALVSLVPLKDNPILNTSSPNKFFESLAAGVPVIQTTNGWMKDFLEQHEIGFTIDPNDPEKLAETLIKLSANIQETNEMGKRAENIAKIYFDKIYLADKMLKILLSVYENNH